MERLGNRGVHTLAELGEWQRSVSPAQRRKRRLADTVPDAAGGSPLVDGIPVNAPQDTTPGYMNAGVAGNVATITFDVVVYPDAPDGTIISNQAFVSAVDQNLADLPSDDPRTDVPDDPTRDVVGNFPLLFAPKTAALQIDNGTPGIVDPGDTLRYEIIVNNNGTELCDDGNTEDGDGCSADCQAVEPGYTCSPPGQPCELCGNGIVEANETCDDGDLIDTNGCNDTCTTVAPNYWCPPTGGGCELCGNGTVAGPEQCDDGGNVSGDGSGAGSNSSSAAMSQSEIN